MSTQPDTASASEQQERRPVAPMVYQAIADMTGEMAREGISKSRENEQQGFQFRGIDDVYAALAPMVSRHRLLMLPEVIERTATERRTKNGGALFHVVLRIRYTFVSAIDGSQHVVTIEGEAMDTADKSTGKAISMAHKSMVFVVFNVPVEGQDNDADLHTHEVSVVMPSAELEKLKARVVETGGDATRWETFVQKQYPQGVPMAAHAKIAADIEAAAASRERAATRESAA